jgi:arylsulfatase A-like enzyme
MSCYGFERPTTPELDRVAADPDGVVFERYYVQGSWTKPSTASLFTGLFLSQHHVSGGSQEGEQTQWFSILSDELDTLAEAFQEAGYTTFSVTSNPHLDPRFGFDQGFDTYSMLEPLDYRLLTETLRRVEESDRPFLGYVHFVACHYPYAVGTRDPRYMATYAVPYDEQARIAEGIDFTGPAIRGAINSGSVTLEPDDVRYLDLIYQARLRAVDQRLVGRMTQGLRDLGVWDDTLLLITADHGEELYDHGGYGHGHDLWEEVIHAPLVVKFPQGGRPEALGERWPGLARAVDIFPSLAALAGIERPRASSGHNVFRGAAVRYSLTDGLNDGDDWALVTGWDKVISRPGRLVLLPVSNRETRLRSAALFDLASDPREARDLVAEAPDRVAAAQRLVKRLWGSLPSPRTNFTDVETEALSEEAVETLRSLGYVD